MNILLTGATGYIGRRLKHRLLKENGVKLRVFVKKGQSVKTSDMVEVAEGSTFDKDSLDNALKGIDTAYYLIHSMESKNYRELDRKSAQNFLDSCIKNGVKRIIYLGGLGEKESASEHLLSRIETGEILSSRPDVVQTLWRNEKNDNAKRLFPNITPLKYEEAVKKATEEIQKSQVISRWSDAGGEAWETDHSTLADAVFTDRQITKLEGAEPKKVFETFCAVGGDNGWFGYDSLWKMRGFIDKIFGGYGLSRGRRDPKTLRISDSVDFWKVVDVEENKRLLLFAQMKLPKTAWLEWLIKDGKLYQTAYFYPHGLLGRLYWYAMLPFHVFIFRGMAQNIIKKAKANG